MPAAAHEQSSQYQHKQADRRSKSPENTNSASPDSQKASFQHTLIQRMPPQHTIRAFQRCLLGFGLLSATASEFRAEISFDVDFEPLMNPPHLVIYEGDKVTWHYPTNHSGTNYLRSFGGEWQTDPVVPGESVSIVFKKPGFYAYHSASYSQTFEKWRTIGTILVRPSDVKPDAISVVAPIEGPVFRAPPSGQYAKTFLARVALSSDQVDRVEFYSSSKLLGAAHVAPYKIVVNELPPGDHLIFARLVPKEGLAYNSKPVRLSLMDFESGSKRFSFFHVLPQGQILFHVVVPIWRNELLYSDDLRTWRVLGRPQSDETVVDVSATNAVRRFYNYRTIPW
jgi:hypothetical protein